MRTLLGFGLLVMGAGVAMAGTICPASPGTGTPRSSGPFSHPPDPAATGCNVVITIAANGSISTLVTDTTAYESVEDTLVGVVNNSSAPVPSLNITGTGIFGFEGDGICTFQFTGNSYCSASAVSGTDPQDYQGPTSTFANISADTNSGTVVFTPPIPAGGSTYFSLENPPTASLVITTGPGTSPVPAPGTLVLLGIGLTLLSAWTFRSQIRGSLFSK
jgi:hypothetical protein